MIRKHNSQFRQLIKLENIIAKNHDNLLPYAEIYAKRRPVTVIGETKLNEFLINFRLYLIQNLIKIGSIAQLGSDEKLTEKVKRLEADIKIFQEELQQSYELIDQLEFEIEEVSVQIIQMKTYLIK